MVKKNLCRRCGTAIDSDALALNLKLLGREARGAMCLECLALYLGTERSALEELVLDLKEQGCTLFLNSSRS